MTLATLRTLREGTPVHEAPGFLSASLFPAGFGGLALPDRIVISSRLEDTSPADREHLVWHEIVHVEQMRQEGTLKFAIVYAGDWVRGRWSGCSHFSAYEAIRYEREADLYAVAMGIAEWARVHSSGSLGTGHHANHRPNGGTDSGAGKTNGYARRIMDMVLDDTSELGRIVEELLDAGFE